MKKIIFLNHSLKFSGAEISLLDVMDILKDHYVLHIILSGKGELFRRLPDGVIPHFLHITEMKRKQPFLRLIHSFAKIIRTSFQICRLLHREQIDIIYFNGNQAAVYLPVIKLLSARKAIWHVRDNVRNNALYHLTGYLADKIICTSQYLFNQIEFHGKKRLVYNGINIVEFNPAINDKPLLRQELPKLNSQVIIAQIGQLVAWKNHDLFIRVARLVAAHCRDVHFLIIGNDPAADNGLYQRQLKEQITAASMTHKVSILDFRYPITPRLNEIDILVHLAETEPFGRVLVEAMAMGKPVVALASGGPAEIVADQQTGFLVAGPSEAQIAEKVIALIHAPAMRSRMGKTGRKTVSTRFSKNNLEKILSILAE